MLSIIVLFFLLGLLLICFEVIVPGGILGLVGVLAIFGAWTLSFIEYGTHGGLLAVGVGLVVVGLTLVIELKFLPRTKMGKRLFLERSIDTTSQEPLASPEVVGKEGEALTTLAPTGVVLIDDRKYEAFSMSGMLEKGTRLQVVDYDNFRVRVKKI